jgi:anion transporter
MNRSQTLQPITDSLWSARNAAQIFDGKLLGLMIALTMGWLVMQLPTPALLDASGLYFLGSLTAGTLLLMFNVYDEYLVGILMLLFWVVSDAVPSEVALAGFSRTSWCFVVAVLGIAVAVNKSGLFHSIAIGTLRRISPSYRIYTLLLTISGLIVTPVMPTSKARMAIAAPLSSTISETMGFERRSNGSAGIGLSAYVGFTQCAFMFLTGATSCLIGWNLLPQPAKSDFGWTTWAVAALPAGVVTLGCLLLGVHYLFPTNVISRPSQLKQPDHPLNRPKSLTRNERISLGILLFALVGWLSKPMHGVSETWVALGALSVFLLTRVLDKEDFKARIDWGFLFFLGVISSFDGIMRHLKIDRWLMASIAPYFSYVTLDPLAFLTVVSVAVYFIRFFLGKTPTVILLSTLGLSSWAQELGVHPGVLLITILMANESWFLLSQNDAYQIAFYSTDGNAFSHAQARKLMVVRCAANFLALGLSVPYWKLLGSIR